MSHRPHCAILPPYLLERLAEEAASTEPEAAQAAAQTLAHERTLRERREMRATRWSGGRPPLPEAPPAPGTVLPAEPGPDFILIGIRDYPGNILWRHLRALKNMDLGRQPLFLQQMLPLVLG